MECIFLRKCFESVKESGGEKSPPFLCAHLDSEAPFCIDVTEDIWYYDTDFSDFRGDAAETRRNRIDIPQPGILVRNFFHAGICRGTTAGKWCKWRAVLWIIQEDFWNGAAKKFR